MTASSDHSSQLRVSRRRVLAGGAAAIGLLTVARTAPASAATTGTIAFPFTLGVASGDPAADSVVLWTRLAPDPVASDGGMPTRDFPVRWEIAEDAGMRRVVRRGVELAGPTLGHSVHAEPRGLAPGRDYWYRFRVGAHVSETGHTKTLPHPRSHPAGIMLAVASCQNFQTGYYTAYRALVADQPDLVLFLGDYIYEYPPGQYGSLPQRQHVGPRIPTDLAGYRIRYGQYKRDPDLRAAHAAAPFVCTWDDHEVANDYAGDSPADWNGGSIPPPTSDPGSAFHRRRAAAYQAYYEHLPLRRPRSFAGWANLRVYQRFQLGDLATCHVLDTRQYRDNQPCDLPQGNLQVDETCTERDDQDRTILGAQQRDWLLDGLSRSSARWNLIAQQLLFAELDQKAGPGAAFEVDGWDGYTADRNRILQHLNNAKVPGAVVLSGDVHTHFVNDLKLDFADPDSPVVATEFVGAAISSPTFGDKSPLLADNPHVKFTSNKNGYIRIRLSPDELHADLRSMRNPGGGRNVLPDSECYTDASFSVEYGHPGARVTMDLDAVK